jgi:aminopeptidase N
VFFFIASNDLVCFLEYNSYLFATVTGKLGSIEDTYTTMTGRVVTLRLFAEQKNVDKLYYALESLKRSMKWDEDRFGLEYDLDLYNIVAVDSFVR